MSHSITKPLTITELKQRLKELSREEVIGLFVVTLKSNKDAQAFVSVKLQGENAIRAAVEESNSVFMWKERLENFLIINEAVPEREKKTRKRKEQSSRC